MLRRTTLLRILIIAVLASFGLGALSASAAPRPPAISILVDADTGVDDAVALAWLLQNPAANIVGITTVAGNTSMENATHNTLTVLDVAGRRDIPVTMGAARPLVYPPSRTGAFVHGPDGLWFAQRRHDLSTIGRDAPAAIAAAARANPGLTVLAVGPLTNIAEAVRRFPTEMASTRIIVLAGTRGRTGRTPVSAFNAWFDPQALEYVLQARLNLTNVTIDGFSQLTVDATDFPRELAARGGALGEFLAQPVRLYFGSTNPNGGQVSIPDVVAAIYALNPDLGTATSSLIQVITSDGVTRGQTVIGTTFNDKITMIADDAELSALADQFIANPRFNPQSALIEIISRQPDNAKVVMEIDEKNMGKLLMRGLKD